MMRTLFLILLLAVSGCASVDHSAVVSPSRAIYFDATRLYDAQDYEGAITKYEAFLEAKPRSDLAIPAKLNLGMSYYYTGNFKEAYDTLTAIEIKDENIKNYVEGIVKECEAKVPQLAQKTQAAQTPTANAGNIEIKVTDAYLDDFGDLNLKGHLNTKGIVIIDQKRIGVNSDGSFQATANWKRGDPVVITAQTPTGATKEIDYYPDGEPPEKPENLRVITISDNSVEIEWDENREDDIKGYRVFYGLKGGHQLEVPDLVRDNKVEVLGTGVIITPTQRTLEFYIRAVDKMNNESVDSNILEVTVP